MGRAGCLWSEHLGGTQHCPCWPALAPSPTSLSVPRLLFPKCHSYVTPCPKALEGFPLLKCINLKHLSEISVSIFYPPRKVDPLFWPLGALQLGFDSGCFPTREASPFLAQILSALKAKQVLPVLIPLICTVSPSFSRTPCTTSQLPCCHQAVPSEVSRDQGGTGDMAPPSGLAQSSAKDACTYLAHLPRQWGSSSCMPTVPATGCHGSSDGVGARGPWSALSVIPIPVISSFSLGTQEAALKYHPGAHLQ